jgi:hypothetical protein
MRCFCGFLRFEFYPAIGRPHLDVETTVQYPRGIDEGILGTESLLGNAIFTNQIFAFSCQSRSWPCELSAALLMQS